MIFNCELAFSQFDAAVKWGDEVAYFFRGDEYFKYDIKSDKPVPGYPAKIKGNWNFPAGSKFNDGIDAAINWGNGVVYFFRGDEYIKYRIANDRPDPGYPHKINPAWNFPAGFSSGVDAAVNWGNGIAYFFKGDKYIKYDISKDSVVGGPGTNIRDWWGFVGEFDSFNNNIDAAINWPNGTAYFFKGGEYAKYKLNGNAPYAAPTKIYKWWGMSAKSESGFRVMVNGLRCLETSENGRDNIYIEAFADGRKVATWGPRLMNESDLDWFEKNLFTLKDEYWLMPGSVYAENSVTIKVWEKDNGQNAAIDSDDLIGQTTINKTTPESNFISKQLTGDGGEYDLVCTKETRKEFDISLLSADRVPIRVPVLDQGNEGACVAFAVTGAITTAWLNRTEPGTSRKQLFDSLKLYAKRGHSIRGWKIDRHWAQS